MPLDPVTAGLDLAGDVVNAGASIADEVMETFQTRQLDAAKKRSTDDVNDFKLSLLAGDLVAVNLRLAGLQHSVEVNLTDAESERLKAIIPNLDGLDLLGLYERARYADLSAECGQIFRDTASTVRKT